MRFLCLHGMGTNAEVFEMQTAALRFELGDQYTFEFVEGSVPHRKLFTSSKKTEFYAYYDPSSTASILSALDSLQDYILDEGPFGGVVGFSQGAALAATLMIRHAQLNPCDTALLFRCAKGLIDDGGSGPEPQPIHVPTAHIMGAKDESVEESNVLAGLCGERGKVVYDHGGGHEVPRAPKEITLGMAQAVREVIDKANFVQ
ncbi:hypothetical protein K440DRAFT_656128 [Wilcoxina mikolae CBS 423.85]|nr:hypothetical protein K440DRAFT_656128 [Wilcoxina mikolae CBS 423.85]